MPKVGVPQETLAASLSGREVPASRGGVSAVVCPCSRVQHWPCPSFCALWRGRHHCPGLQIIPTKNLWRTMGSSQLRIMRIETIRQVFMEREAFEFTWQMEPISSASLQCAWDNEECLKHVLPGSIGFPSSVSCMPLSSGLPSPRESSPLPRTASFLPPLHSDPGQSSSGVCCKAAAPSQPFSLQSQLLFLTKHVLEYPPSSSLGRSEGSSHTRPWLSGGARCSSGAGCSASCSWPVLFNDAGLRPC